MDLLLILLLSFTLRLLQTLRQAGDNSVHLWKIKTVGRRLSRLCAVDDSLFPAYQGYPGLPHLLVSFLPERRQAVGAYLANIAFDGSSTPRMKIEPTRAPGTGGTRWENTMVPTFARTATSTASAG